MPLEKWQQLGDQAAAAVLGGDGPFGDYFAVFRKDDLEWQSRALVCDNLRARAGQTITSATRGASIQPLPAAVLFMNSASAFA